MTSIIFALLIGCGEEKDSGFYIDITGLDTAVDLKDSDDKEPSDESGEPNEPDNPNEPDGPNDTDNPNDTGTGNSGDITVDDDGDGFTEEEGDCDDTNVQFSPGAMDFPDDGADQDCDGLDSSLVDVPGGLANGNLDTDNNGVPAGWSNIGEAWSWQGSGANIFTVDGDTGVSFVTHTPGGGALKIWGDYGANTVSPGESAVFQEFVAEENVWSPDGKVFWLRMFGYISSQDPLQAAATGTGYIRCFEVDSSGNYTLLEEAHTQYLNIQTQQDSWRNLSTWVQCGPTANVVQAVLVFEQSNTATDHGVLYFDDVIFAEVQ